MSGRIVEGLSFVFGEGGCGDNSFDFFFLRDPLSLTRSRSFDTCFLIVVCKDAFLVSGGRDDEERLTVDSRLRTVADLVDSVTEARVSFTSRDDASVCTAAFTGSRAGIIDL
jgi:hypothetical protein